MLSQEVFDRLTAILRDVFDDDDLEPYPEMTAEDVEDWDSLSHIRLIVAVEKEMCIKFSNAEITNIENVGHFAKLIDKKIAA